MDQGRRQEGEVRRDAGELAGHAAIRGQDGIARPRRIIAGLGQDLDGAAGQGRRARRSDPVALAGGVDLDLIGRACREGDIASDAQRPDRVARRHRAAAPDRDPADRAGAAERRPAIDRHRTRQRAIDHQPAAIDGGRAGIGVGARQRQRAGAGLDQRAAAADHAAHLGRVAIAAGGERPQAELVIAGAGDRADGIVGFAVEEGLAAGIGSQPCIAGRGIEPESQGT